MLVLQFLRNAFGLLGFDFLGRGTERFVGFAIFWRATHVGGGVGEGNARLRHPDELDGLLCRDGERQRFRIGQADVLACENNDASRDETKIFASMQHFREPIDRALFVGSAHALDKCADRVVVRISDAIVDDRFLLDAFLRNREIEMNDAIPGGTRSCVDVLVGDRTTSQHVSSAFQAALRASPSLTWARNIERLIGDFRRCNCRVRALCHQGASHQSDQVVRPQRLQAKNLRTRNERAVDVEERIVSRRADQSQISTFDIGQQNVLLRFVEMMDLVYENDCLLASIAQPVGRGGNDAAHFGDVAFHAAESDEFRLCHFRDDVRERRFPGAGWTG